MPHDYILAASRMKFVDPGFPLTQLTPYLGRKRVDTPFRTFRYIDSEMARLLRELIDGTPDATESYLGEIRRLEKLNLAKYGYRYRNWKREEGFTWSAAPPFLGIEQFGMPCHYGLDRFEDAAQMGGHRFDGAPVRQPVFPDVIDRVRA